MPSIFRKHLNSSDWILLCGSAVSVKVSHLLLNLRSPRDCWSCGRAVVPSCRRALRACGTSLVRWMALQCAKRTVRRLALQCAALKRHARRLALQCASGHVAHVTMGVANVHPIREVKLKVKICTLVVPQSSTVTSVI